MAFILAVVMKCNILKGRVITNQARVNFDGVGPWNPAPKEAPFLNTIDTDIPSSRVTQIISTEDPGVYDVFWSGVDSTAGINTYSIYLSIDEGPYEQWIEQTADTSAQLTVDVDQLVRLYSVAQDGVGHIEPHPDSFDIQQRLTPTGIADTFEFDNLTFDLSQNYPNPFNPSTTILYTVAKETNVRIEIFDTLGRRVALLVDEEKGRGRHEVTWQPQGVSSGVFFYRMQTTEFEQVRSMILLK